MVTPKKIDQEIEELDYEEDDEISDEYEGEEYYNEELQNTIKQIKEARAPLTLDLSINNIGEDAAKFLAEAIKEVIVPLTLYLSDNHIGEAGAEFLAEAIKEARAPLTLDLSINSIEKAGAKFLAEGIKEVQAPLNLDLSINDIGEVGAEFLAEGIKEARAPITLDLSYNNIKDAGVKFLAKAIKEARAPLTLYLSDNRIGEAGAEFLAEAIKEARAPLTLDLSGNRIGEAGAKFLAEAIKEARAPFTLYLSSSDVGETGAKFLAEAEEDNFIIDARSKPSMFLHLIKMNPSIGVIEQESGLPSVLANLILDYIDYDELVWLDVAAIRAVEGASIDNKYSSINYKLLSAVYFPKEGVKVISGSASDGKQMVYNSQDVRGDSSSGSSSSLQSQVLNLLLLLSRIKTLSNRLETPQGYVDVPGDGLCFYHAISSQLGGNVYSALELQQMAINEIMTHLDRYEGFAAQYGGGLDGFLNYHLQRQDSEKGGWADNIMIQALANALERVIEVQLFDRAGNAIGAGPVVINPHHVANPNALRLGNIEDLHFVAAAPIAANEGGEEVRSSSANAMVDDSPQEQTTIAKPLKRKQDFVEDSKAHKVVKLEAERTIQEDEVNVPEEDEGDNCEEEIDWDQYRCEVQDEDTVPTPAPTVISERVPTSNATSQIYYETLELGDASSFEFRPVLVLSGMDSTVINS